MTNIQVYVLIAIVISVVTKETFAGITVQIAGASRLGNPLRSSTRYSCYWDCNLVACHLTRENDDCDYTCHKVCRPKYDYSARSDSSSDDDINIGEPQESDLKPKSSSNTNSANLEKDNEITKTG